MKITINPEDYAISVADEKIPIDLKYGDYKEREEWLLLYKETYDSVTDFAITPTIPIKLYGTKEFCKDIGVNIQDFGEAFYQLNLNIKKERKTLDFSPLFKFIPITSKEGSQLDIAINSLHPCLIKMIFAYLHKPELIDKALELIANYEKD